MDATRTRMHALTLSLIHKHMHACAQTISIYTMCATTIIHTCANSSNPIHNIHTCNTPHSTYHTHMLYGISKCNQHTYTCYNTLHHKICGTTCSHNTINCMHVNITCACTHTHYNARTWISHEHIHTVEHMCTQYTYLQTPTHNHLTSLVCNSTHIHCSAHTTTPPFTTHATMYTESHTI